MSFKIQLEKFEGPLDLLLYFIRRDELDIYDIPISKITEDFINTINEWKRLNLVIAGEFIVMASTLMRIKARMMIPRIDLDEEGENIDPRTELMQRLIDYKRFRSAADILNNMASENSGHFKRQPDLSKISDKNDEGLDAFFKDVSLFDLATLFKNAMDDKPVLSPFELNKDPIKLEKQKEVIFNYFDGEGKLSFNNLLSILKTRLEVIVTFLAILDLVKEGSCALFQADVFSDIQLINRKIRVLVQKSEIKKIIEALLFSARDPLTQAQVNNVFEPDTPDLNEMVEKLNKQYLKNGNAFVIHKVAGGFQIVSKKEYEHFIRKLYKKSGRLTLSLAAMDSLAIIAYKQPISRYEVEAIRGVDSSGVLKTLLNHELIKIKGRDIGPGRPLLIQNNS